MGRLSPVQILTLLSLAGIHAFVPAIPNAAAVGRVTMMSSVGREGGSMLMGVGQGGAGAAWAENMCRQALSGIALEYPHKIDHLWAETDGPLASPRSLHPSFYGSYDWHSSVHSHWALCRLLRLHRRDLSSPAAVEAALRSNLDAEKLVVEAHYLSRPGAATFERPYGWGWALKLASECKCGAEEGSQLFEELSVALEPLTQTIRDLWLAYLPRLAYPVRTGVHSNTAFALTLSIDYARQARDVELEEALIKAARRLYEGDTGYDARFEPSGEDFLSPGVCELLLMRSVLPLEEYAGWAMSFAPSLADATSCALLKAPKVGDRDDARLCHLDGVLLSKSWGLRAVSAGLRGSRVDASICDRVEQAADVHYREAKWMTDNYSGTHWLHSFALLALTEGASF